MPGTMCKLGAAGGGRGWEFRLVPDPGPGPLLFRLGDDLLGDVVGDFLVPAERAHVVAAALGQRAQVRRVAVELRLRDLGLDLLLAGPRGLHPQDPPPALVEIADDVPEVLVRCDHGDVHDRLQQNRVGALAGVLEGHRARDLERHLAGVHGVIGAVVQLHSAVDDRIPRDDPLVERFLNPLVDRGNELLRDRAARYLVDERVALSSTLRNQPDPAIAELAAPAGLFLVPTLRFRAPPDRLPIGDLRLLHVRLDVELPLHALEHDLEMQLAHSTNDGLPELRVVRVNERRIFLVQLGQRVADLLLLAFLVGLDGHRDDGSGEIHSAKDDAMLPGAESVAGMRPLELGDDADVPTHEIGDLGAVLPLHDPDMGPPLTLSARPVRARRAARDLATPDAEVRELADVRLGRGLEDQRARRRIGVGGDEHLFVRAGAGGADLRPLGRVGDQLYDLLEERTHAVKLERRTAEDREQLAGSQARLHRGENLLA